jgi:hypothetical protein
MDQVHGLIMELAVYEREPDAVIITPADLIQHGFVDGKFECFVAEDSETNSLVTAPGKAPPSISKICTSNRKCAAAA